MRLGPRGWRPPPQKAMGYGLMTVGAVILLLSLPVYVYAALVGGLIAYLGHTMKGR